MYVPSSNFLKTKIADYEYSYCLVPSNASTIAVCFSAIYTRIQVFRKSTKRLPDWIFYSAFVFKFKFVLSGFYLESYQMIEDWTGLNKIV